MAIVRTKSIIYDLDGTPCKAGLISDGRGGANPDPNSADLTVREVVLRALNTYSKNVEPTAEESTKRYKFMSQFNDNGIIDDFSATDAAYIIALVGVSFAPWILGKVSDALEGKDIGPKKASDKIITDEDKKDPPAPEVE